LGTRHLHRTAAILRGIASVLMLLIVFADAVTQENGGLARYAYRVNKMFAPHP